MLRKFSTRMAALFVAIVASAAAAAPPAHAAEDREKVVYVVCYVFSTLSDNTAISLPPHKTTYFAGWFNANVESKVYDQILPGTGYRSARCNWRDTLEKAEAYYRESGYNFVKRVEWPKGFWPNAGATAAPLTKPDSTPTPPPKPTSSTGAITVKTDTSARDSAKAWDEQVRKTLAAEAQKKVETAARQAQADAKKQAEISAFFAERRKQGRAQ